MHPWMIEQVAREQRRELLARASRPHVRRPWTWRSLASYIGIRTIDRGASASGARPSLARLTGGAPGRRPTPAGEPATAAPMPTGSGRQASAA
jgi:hypothetical protein